MGLLYCRFHNKSVGTKHKESVFYLALRWDLADATAAAMSHAGQEELELNAEAAKAAAASEFVSEDDLNQNYSFFKVSSEPT